MYNFFFFILFIVQIIPFVLSIYLTIIFVFFLVKIDRKKNYFLFRYIISLSKKRLDYFYVDTSYIIIFRIYIDFFLSIFLLFYIRLYFVFLSFFIIETQFKLNLNKGKKDSFSYKNLKKFLKIVMKSMDCMRSMLIL